MRGTLVLPKTLDVRLELRKPVAGGGLAGSGLLIVNPPWPLEDGLSDLLPELVDRLGQGQGAGSALAWLTPETAR